MKIQNLKQVCIALIASIGFASLSNVANAVPLTADIDIANSWSLIHPVPNGDSADWLWFDGGQTIDLDLTGGILTLDGAQTFGLSSNNGATSILDITGLTMDLNDTDGFLGGSMDYILDGMVGTFAFSNSNYGNSVFNSSSNVGGNFELFAWGGDSANELGIDFGISATTVSEPAILVLMLTGFAGLAFVRRRNK